MNKYALSAIGVLAFAFTVYLGAVHGIAISFAFLAIIVSTFFASRSLKLTRDSLELTRANIRPFLYMQPNQMKVLLTDQYMKFEFVLKNDGVLPGDIISTDIAFFSNDEVITLDNDSTIYHIKCEPSSEHLILFPGNSTNVGLSILCNSAERRQLADDIGESKVVIRHRVFYRRDNLHYSTVQTGFLRKESTSSLIFLHKTPQHWT